ncbi:MAG TPA: LytR family transcriptional regulator [bacterium (Candidatus Stahlbacteria)]|nr:LytR family transcriptional regulator [Candidatus Stahlbacteria bacterium]
MKKSKLISFALFLLGLFSLFYLISIGDRLVKSAKKEKKDLSSIRVQVLNGCGKTGMAKEVATFLRAKGFDVVDIGNTEYILHTVILDRSDREQGNAIYVRKALRQGKLAFEPDPALFLEVTVIIGGDFKPRRIGIEF